MTNIFNFKVIIFDIHILKISLLDLKNTKKKIWDKTYFLVEISKIFFSYVPIQYVGLDFTKREITTIRGGR